MKGRVLLTGLVAGVALFVWLSIAHVALPTGKVGISEIPNEDAVMASMKTNMPEPGFYYFPSGGVLTASTDEQKKAAQAVNAKKIQAGPGGILIYHTEGTAELNPRQLVVEFSANIVEALLAVWLISLAHGLSFTGRICFGATVGLVGTMMTNISYWNWYGFPTSYTISNLFIQVVGFAVVGLVAALMLPRHAKDMIGAGKQLPHE